MYYSPLDLKCKSVKGAVPCDTSITFNVFEDACFCNFLIKKDGACDYSLFPMEKNKDGFTLKTEFLSGLYFYLFQTEKGIIGSNSDYVGEYNVSNDFQLSVYDKNFVPPDKLYGGIIYQIFPDRFFKKGETVLEDGKVYHEKWEDLPYFLPNEDGKVLNNDFFGGNLKGIEYKLDYLESLGVSAIYLNPIFKAYSNHRYDTGDYMKIDGTLGDEKDLTSLVEKAKEKGIEIILDGVFNHTGDDSIYFNKYGTYDSVGAYSGKESPYYDWYNFHNGKDDYESWWGIKTLPTTVKTSGYSDYIAGENGVIEYWMKKGIGGFRLDVVDELPSYFVRKIRNAVKKVNVDAVIIGEVWEDASNKISYGIRREYFMGKELDFSMNYPLKNAIIDFVKSGKEQSLISVIKEQTDHYPKAVLDGVMNFLSTHDTKRILSELSFDDVSSLNKVELSDYSAKDIISAKKRLRLATVLLYTLYGVPSVYYGDEAGVEGYFDPINRKTYPWGNEDLELVDFYKKLGKIRRENSCFISGELSIVYAKFGGIFYKRSADDSELLIAVNIGEKKKVSFLGKMKDLISGKTFDGYFEIDKGEYLILKTV